MWIGGSGGLSVFRGGRVATVDAGRELAGSRVLAIMEDQRGYFWLTVYRGVIRVPKQEIVAALASRTHRRCQRRAPPRDRAH